MDMDQGRKLKGAIPFPCHKRKKAMVFECAHGLVSHECPVCGAMALFNYDTMSAEPYHMIRGASQKFQKII